MTAHVPFNRPSFVGRELEYITAAVAGSRLAGDGPFTKRCEAWLEAAIGCRRALLVHSCTGALELAALLCGVGPGDEVIMPSYTFVSTANAFVLRGARPVFVDIRPDTLNLDESQVPAAITHRTRALVPVHYAGVACAMEPMLALARKHDLRVVEDAAQAIGSTWRGRPLGGIGDLGALSFHETKNLLAGEGGALLIRDDEALIARAEILREKGTNRSQFFRGQIDKYTWVDVGSSYLPSELVAAFLLAQFEQAGAVLARRRAIASAYRVALSEAEESGLVRLPVVPADCLDNGHLFYLLLPDESRRDAMLAGLAARGINAVFHYVPLHESPMGAKLGYRRGMLPVTEEMSRRLVRLPTYVSMTDDEQRAVIGAVRALLGLAAG
jgi:dTDP-4-amino-4,6-dideoxygalactose transaminase